MRVPIRMFAVFLSGVMIVLAGCETVPALQVTQETYPASGPTGFRLGGSYQRNVESDEVKSGDARFDGTDTTDFWADGGGAFFEVPVDVNPFFGGFAGVGFDQFVGESKNGVDTEDLQLYPFYVGLTARLPFWLDWEKWDSSETRIWLPNDPVGPALYARGLGGGALLYAPPRFELPNGDRTRAVDVQTVPFWEGNIGAEYRFRDWGIWAEVGYRHYELEGGRDDFDWEDMAGIRTSIGMSWYGF